MKATTAIRSKTKPWDHQVRAYEFVCEKPGAMLAMDMGCVDGEAVLTINRGGCSQRMKLSELHLKFNGFKGRWRKDIETKTRSLCDGEIRLNRIVEVIYQGKKPVLRISLSSGRSIRVTPDHEMATPTGWRRADKLLLKCCVLTNGIPTCRDCGSTKKVATYRYAKYRGLCRSCILSTRYAKKKGTPVKTLDKDGYLRLNGMRSHHRSNPAGQVYEHIVVMENLIGRPINRQEHVHHVNGDKADNRPENLRVLSPSEHYRGHKLHLNLETEKVIFTPRKEQVVSIVPDGSIDVFDVVMDDPFRNFVADGFIVHNCGKSKVVVDLVVNRGHGFTVIVCPLSVVDVWPNQFLLHAADPVVVLPLKKRPVAWRLKKLQKELALRKARGDGRPFVAVMNFECFRTQTMASFLKKLALQGFLELLVIDESHRIKSPGGKGSRVASNIGELVPWRLTLTGTPMPHSPLDVYAQFRFLDRNVYGWSFRRFKQRYAVMGGFRKGGRPMQVVGFRELEDLHAKFYSLAFRVKKDDVLDLPPYIHETRTCELDPESRRLYDTLEKEFVAQVKTGEVTVANALTKLLRLQQIANGFVRSDEQEVGEITETGNEKEKLLLDIVEDLPNDEPVVVFCRFHHDLDVVKRACRSVDREPLELSGRVNELEEWQRGEAPILAVQIQAGGVGVDLTRAAYCLYWSVGFNLGDYEQSLARLHRPGQERSVTYIHLVTAGTVEEKVMKSLEKKQNVIKTVLEQIIETPF